MTTIMERRIKKTKQTAFPCGQCSKIFTRKETLNDHVKVKHEGIKFSCDMCDKSFASQSILLIHKKKVHKGKSQKCDICEESFFPPSILKKHIENVHALDNTLKPLLQCPQCEKTFTSKKSWSLHIKSVHDGRKYSDQLSTTALVRRNATKNLENSCFILN